MPDQATEKRIYWAQIKCARGHCVLGLASMAESDEDAAASKDGCWREFYNAIADPKCPICEDTTFSLEIRRTNFDDIQEAIQVLAAISVERDLHARIAQRHENN